MGTTTPEVMSHAGQVDRPAAGWLVPVPAVAIAGVVVVLLFVSLVGNWLWALDFFHVAGGALWTGVDLFMGFVIGPVMGGMEPAARIAFLRRLMPRMLIIMPTLVLVTLASGWQLARELGNLVVAYPQHWWLVASYIVVGIMAIIAYTVLEPVNIFVLLELRKPQPNGPLIGRLMKRFIYTAAVTGAMQIATLIIMTRIATW